MWHLISPVEGAGALNSRLPVEGSLGRLPLSCPFPSIPTATSACPAVSWLPCGPLPHGKVTICPSAKNTQVKPGSLPEGCF